MLLYTKRRNGANNTYKFLLLHTRLANEKKHHTESTMSTGDRIVKQKTKTQIPLFW